MNNENIRIGNESDAMGVMNELIEYSSILYEISDNAAEYVMVRLEALKDALERSII